MNPREFDERTSERNAKPPWWRVRFLRVRPRFAGMEVSDHPKNPRDLIGYILPWSALHETVGGRSFALYERDGRRMVRDGRRLTASFENDRCARFARLLCQRSMKQALEASATVCARSSGSRWDGLVVRWIMWLAGTSWVAIYAYMFVGSNRGQNWLASQPWSVILLAVLTFALLGCIMMIILIGSLWFGWQIGRPAAAHWSFDRIGCRTVLSNGRMHEFRWSDVRSIKRRLHTCIETNDGEVIRFDLQSTTWRALISPFVDRNPPTRQDRLERAKYGGLDRATYRRVYFWLIGGAVVVAAIGALIGALGLTPKPWWEIALSSGVLILFHAAAMQLIIESSKPRTKRLVRMWRSRIRARRAAWAPCQSRQVLGRDA